MNPVIMLANEKPPNPVLAATGCPLGITAAGGGWPKKLNAITFQRRIFFNHNGSVKLNAEYRIDAYRTNPATMETNTLFNAGI